MIANGLVKTDTQKAYTAMNRIAESFLKFDGFVQIISTRACFKKVWI
jgi:hypothetical protein